MRRPIDIGSPIGQGMLIHQNGEGEFIGRIRRAPEQQAADEHHQASSAASSTATSSSHMMMMIPRSLVLRLPWMVSHTHHYPHLLLIWT